MKNPNDKVEMTWGEFCAFIVFAWLCGMKSECDEGFEECGAGMMLNTVEEGGELRLPE